jgi:hypothetical protein
MNPILRLLEIFILLILPLMIIYLRSSWSRKEISIYLAILPLIWYIFYAPLHELGHILGCFVVGLEVKDYQLFARFWEGNFGFAYVDIKEGYGENIKSFVVLIFPYVLDLVSIIIGYYILVRYKIRNSFLFGLIFIILCLRPLYDLVDNYIGYFLNHSDFVFVSRIAGIPIVFTFVILSIIICVILILVLIHKYKLHPKNCFGKLKLIIPLVKVLHRHYYFHHSLFHDQACNY